MEGERAKDLATPVARRQFVVQLHDVVVIAATDDLLAVRADGDTDCYIEGCRVAIGIGAAAATPLRLDSVANALQGTRAETEVLRPALVEALTNIEMFADLHASAEYRRRAAVALTLRAVADAYQDARTRGGRAR